MKLFKPQEIKSQSQAELEVMGNKRQELDLWIKKGIATANELREKTAQERQEIMENLGQLISAQLFKKIELEKETEALRAYRIELLKPIDELKTEARQQLDAALQAREKVTQDQAEVNEQREELVTRLGDVNDFKAELDRREDVVGKKEKSIEQQQEFLTSSSSNLMQQWEKFYQRVEEVNGELDLKARRLDDSIRSNEVLRAEIENDRLTLRNDRKHFISQQTAFKAAEKALKKKYGKS